MQLTRQSLFSRISIFLSSICVIHCLSVPFIIIAMPTLSVFFSSTLETVFVLSIIPISALAFFPTWRLHKNYKLLTGYLVSILILVSAHFGYHSLQFSHHYIETILMLIGATGLAVVLYKINRHTHVCNNPHHEHHHHH